MGGAISIEPPKGPDVSRVLAVISNDDKTKILFKKIANHGYEKKKIIHTKLGSKHDTICLPEIILYITSAEDPFFKDLCVKPLTVVIEAYYYAMKIDTTK